MLGSHHPASGLIKTTLGVGTARTALSRHSDNERTNFTVEREMDSDPRVYCEEVREHANLGILECFEIYSQAICKEWQMVRVVG
jgi:hypothetical protein